MAKIISVNAGSSSLKFQLFEMDDESVITSGVIERIGLEDSIFTIKYQGKKTVTTNPIKDHKVAVQLLLDTLIEKGIVKELNEIKGVGHRVVQGGSYFDSSAIIDEDVVSKIDELKSLAPLHNPAHLTGYYAFKEAIPEAGAVAVFDTAFHQTMKPEAFMYPLPYEDYKELKVRKYGFHGTSHLYVSGIMREIMGNPEHSKIIVCHLGNGASITAVKDGKSVDTSMGLTPLQGLMMGTRCGDIDPAAVLFVKNKRGLTDAQMDDRMNKKSGILGLFGKSSDCRDLENAVLEGDERAILAESVSMHRLRSYIGAYAAVMGGVDAICFTGGIGENSSMTRERALEGLEFLGVELDKEINSVRKKGNVKLSKDSSKVLVYKIPTNEELVIARDTFRLAK